MTAPRHSAHAACRNNDCQRAQATGFATAACLCDTAQPYLSCLAKATFESNTTIQALLASTVISVDPGTTCMGSAADLHVPPEGVQGRAAKQAWQWQVGPCLLTQPACCLIPQAACRLSSRRSAPMWRRGSSPPRWTPPLRQARARVGTPRAAVAGSCLPGLDGPCSVASRMLLPAANLLATQSRALCRFPCLSLLCCPGQSHHIKLCICRSTSSKLP